MLVRVYHLYKSVRVIVFSCSLYFSRARLFRNSFDDDIDRLVYIARAIVFLVTSRHNRPSCFILDRITY